MNKVSEMNQAQAGAKTIINSNINLIQTKLS
jgi:hypothetical protein